MNNFLERVSIIESRMPTVLAYKVFLTRVFASMMNLLAIATKAVKKGRFSKKKSRFLVLILSTMQRNGSKPS